MHLIRQVAARFPILFVALICPGCGGGGVVVTGQLVQDGKPISVSENGLIMMSVTSDDAQKAYTAEVNKEGKFTIRDSQGGGIPPGKYKIYVRWFDPYTGEETDVDKLKGAFAEGQGKAIERSIEPGQSTLTIDLAKP